MRTSLLRRIALGITRLGEARARNMLVCVPYSILARFPIFVEEARERPGFPNPQARHNRYYP